MSTNPLPLFSLGTTLGAMLIGATLASALFGVSTMLFFVYYRRYSQDSWFYRYSLALLWVLDALHFVLALHILYFYLVESFGDVITLPNIVWSFKLDFSTHLAIVVGVNLVCVVRLWILGRYFHRIVPWILSLAVAGAVSVMILAIYEVYTISTFFQFSDISRIMDGVLIVGAISDLTICLSMSYYLFKSRTVTVFSRLSGRLLILLRLVLMSGLAATAASILLLVVFLTLPDTLIFAAIAFPLPRLYIISLLTIAPPAVAFTRLNARTPQPSNKSSHAKGRLSMEANEANKLPLNFMDAPLTDEQVTAEWSLHDPSGGN